MERKQEHMTAITDTYLAETYTAKLNPNLPSPELLALSAEVIRQGGLVAFPTETVYGLGANAWSESAVDNIFRAKQRPANDPIIVHIDDMELLQEVAVDIPDIAYTLIDKFWAGALTLILKKHDRIPFNVTAGRGTVAVRMPNHPVALGLIHQANVPIAAPSANRFSRPSPTTAQHVLEDLDGHVDIVLDAGATDIGIESTVLDLTSAIPTVLRPGGVSIESLHGILPMVSFVPQLPTSSDASFKAPGMMTKHYAPSAEMWVFNGTGDDDEAVLKAMVERTKSAIAQGQTIGIIAFDDEAHYFNQLSAHVIPCGDTLEAMAQNLFASIRELDQQGVDAILVRAPDFQGIGLAVRNRLARSAEGKLISVPS